MKLIYFPDRMSFLAVSPRPEHERVLREDPAIVEGESGGYFWITIEQFNPLVIRLMLAGIPISVRSIMEGEELPSPHPPKPELASGLRFTLYDRDESGPARIVSENWVPHQAQGEWIVETDSGIRLAMRGERIQECLDRAERERSRETEGRR